MNFANELGQKIKFLKMKPAYGLFSSVEQRKVLKQYEDQQILISWNTIGCTVKAMIFGF